MVDINQTVVDAEIVDEGQTDAKLLLSLSEMIKNNISIIDNTKVELNEQRDMLKDILANDTTFTQQEDEVKKASKIRNATKAQILKRPQVALVSEKVKSLQSQIRESNAALSDYLREYQKVSGQNTIEGENGDVMEIKFVAKLKRLDKRKGR